jgi:hypothetical protein
MVAEREKVCTYRPFDAPRDRAVVHKCLAAAPAERADLDNDTES